jgi:hypothetical protein
MTQPSDDQELRRIFSSDQVRSAMPQAAKEIAALFHGLRHEGLTREEALSITNTWVAGQIMKHQGGPRP